MRLALLASVLLAACGAPKAWLPAEAGYSAPKAGFDVTVPQGWMRRNVGERELLYLTRDGSALQSIYVGSTELGKPLGLGGGKRPITAGLSPQELGEAVIDDLSSARSLSEVRVLESAPDRLAGRRGFRVVAAFRDSDGLRVRLAMHGAIDGGRMYWLLYVAPARHYFAVDLARFEEMARSFRLRAPAARAPAPPST